jgi:hypothetical protein
MKDIDKQVRKELTRLLRSNKRKVKEAQNSLNNIYQLINNNGYEVNKYTGRLNKKP